MREVIFIEQDTIESDLRAELSTVESAIRIRGFSKRWARDGEPVFALKNISLDVARGAIHGVVGRSGAGKSTLLRCIAALERPDEGSVLVEGRDWTELRPGDLMKERSKMAVIFQQLHLLSSRTALDNVALPLELGGVARSERIRRASELLQHFGLADKATAYPSQLSGGQRQRVALARALASQPTILLADEPTSALDYATRDAVLEVLRRIREELGVTILMITHDLNAARAICDTVSVLSEGRLRWTGAPGELTADRLEQDPLPTAEFLP